MTTPHIEPGASAPGQYAEIRARADAATPGRWYVEEGEDVWQLFAESQHVGEFGGFIMPSHPWQLAKCAKRDTPFAEYWPNEADSQFIAHVRTDVVVLLDRVEQLETALTHFRDLTEDYHACGAPDVRELADRVRDARRALFALVQP